MKLAKLEAMSVGGLKRDDQGRRPLARGLRCLAKSEVLERATLGSADTDARRHPGAAARSSCGSLMNKPNDQTPRRALRRRRRERPAFRALACSASRCTSAAPAALVAVGERRGSRSRARDRPRRRRRARAAAARRSSDVGLRAPARGRSKVIIRPARRLPPQKPTPGHRALVDTRCWPRAPTAVRRRAGVGGRVRRRRVGGGGARAAQARAPSSRVRLAEPPAPQSARRRRAAGDAPRGPSCSRRRRRRASRSSKRRVDARALLARARRGSASAGAREAAADCVGAISRIREPRRSPLARARGWRSRAGCGRAPGRPWRAMRAVGACRRGRRRPRRRRVASARAARRRRLGRRTPPAASAPPTLAASGSPVSRPEDAPWPSAGARRRAHRKRPRLWPRRREISAYALAWIGAYVLSWVAPALGWPGGERVVVRILHVSVAQSRLARDAARRARQRRFFSVRFLGS